MAHSNLPVVVLFEDDQRAKGKGIEDRLRAALEPTFKLVRFNLQGSPAKSIPYEDLLVESLSSNAFKNLALIVSDRDISMSGYPGLSEAAVGKAAARLGIPICVYASGKSDDIFERQRTGGDGRIVLDPKTMSRTVPAIARGMVEVREKLEKIINGSAKNRPRGAAALLACILETAQATEHLALYARGDQRMIAELLHERPQASKQSGWNKALEEKRMATALGVWLFDSVLRFPGLVLDSLAAGSFLGIAPERMNSPEVVHTFKASEYNGPFASADEPRWWRFKLVEQMAVGKVNEGRDLVKTKSRGGLPRAVCAVDGRSPAGAVCIVTRTAVCDEHSVGQISWLPRGADLSRVQKKIFDEIAPWIGT